MRNINKIYRILKIFMLCMTIFLTLKSCAKAVVNTTQLTEDLNKIVEKGAIAEFPKGSNWNSLVGLANDYNGYFILITGNSGSYANSLIIGTWSPKINSAIKTYTNTANWRL